MTHQKMMDRLPSAQILSNRNELKIYQGNIIYLNNEDNFQIQFFNPTNSKIGVEIIFNGVKKGDSYLVLNPGQDVTLDRFLDEQRKMVFETYTIDGNNSSAMKAIEQNGLITFNFYKEYYRSNFRNYDNDVNINYNFPPKPNRYNSGTHYTKGLRTKNSGAYNTTIYPSATISTDSLNISDTSNTNYYDNVSFTSSFTSYNGIIGQTGANGNSGIFNGSSTTNITTSLNNVETGRVERGEISSQQLRQVNAQFQSNAFHTISYKMLPNSSKNQNINEIRQYCGHCGYRLRKQSWNYCPKCGSEVC